MLKTITYNFEEVCISKTKYGKCSKCGKNYQETKKFAQTINPYNKNADGQIKTYDEIYDELVEKAKKWLEEPISEHNCKIKKEEITEPLTDADIEKIKSIDKIYDEILTMIQPKLNELKEIKNSIAGKCFIGEDREYKIDLRVYSPQKVNMYYLSALGKNKSSGKFETSKSYILQHNYCYDVDTIINAIEKGKKNA